MKLIVWFGRLFLLISLVWVMKDLIDIDNVRIRFKFDVVENFFNLFYI